MAERMERVCRVLLAEDNPNDIRIFESAARKSECRFDLQVVTDGETALDFLRKTGERNDAWIPDLVVLNINMPKISGWDVLKHMNADPKLRLLRVVMWTIAPPEIRDYAKMSFEKGCCGGFTKQPDPVRAESQVKAMLEFYWWAWSHPRAGTQFYPAWEM